MPIEELRASIRARRPGQRRNRVDGQFEISFALAGGILGALPIVDIREQNVPSGDMPARVVKWKPTNLKPAVHAIETPDARLEVVWIA
jgi:hypothetical protein